MKLSEHFTFEEMVRTDVRWAMEQNKIKATAYLPSIKQVADELGEPVRLLWPDSVIRVHSCFRYPELNAVIHGSPVSQHLIGRAMDFTRDRRSTQAELVDDMYTIMASSVKFHQLLVEYGCLHISLPTGERDGEVAWWEAGVKRIIRAGS